MGKSAPDQAGVPFSAIIQRSSRSCPRSVDVLLATNRTANRSCA